MPKLAKSSTLAAPLGAEDLRKRLIQDAVDTINGTYVRGVLETHLEIGRYILKTFFNGDFEVFQEYGAKHTTFLALSEHPGLRFHPSLLGLCVRVLAQTEALPREVAEGLSFTDHRRLLPLKDEEQKKSLARRAVQGEWSSRDLAAEVDKALGRKRRPKPAGAAFLAGLKLASRAAEILGEEAPLFSEKDLPDKKVKELIQGLESDLEVLEKALEDLKALRNEMR
jgi:hypothetical protein